MSLSSRFILNLERVYDSLDVRYTLHGLPLENEHDILKLKDACFLWVLSVWDLADPSWYPVLYSHLPQLLIRLSTCDIPKLVKWLDFVKEQLYNCPDNTTILWDLFKGERLGMTLYSGHLIVPIKALGGEKLDRVSFRAVNTFLTFITKLNIEMDIQKELTQEYVDDDIRLLNVDINTSDVDFMQEVVTDWFKSFRFDEDINPQHGPGAVAEFGRISIYDKYRTMGTDQRLEYFLSRDRASWSDDFPSPKLAIQRASELVFVPKSLKTYRTICKEPSSLQYWQQYVAKNLVKFVSRHPYLSKRIRITDQSFARGFCLEASKSGEYATIDLSKASDTVSYALVKKVFQKTPLLRGLVGTRSDFVRLPNGETIKINKFAPMGSALCFPIECIMFAAVVELAIASSSGKNKRYSIYGDDIIISSHHVPNLLIKLQRLGFLPNKQKSYYSPRLPFRESCGMEAWNGYDVSPLRLPRNFSSLRIDKKGSNISQLIDLANRCFTYGLKSVRSRILHAIRVSPYSAQLYTVPNGLGIWSNNPTNFHLRTEWKNGQRHYKHLVMSSKNDLSCSDESDYELIRLHERFRAGSPPEGTTHIGKTYNCWRWVFTPTWFSMIVSEPSIS